MKKRNFFWSQSSTPHLPSLRSVSNWGQRSHYCCTESFQCRLYFGIMNLSVLVIESSVASTNQIAKGMLLASIRFVKFTPTNQIRYSLRADQRKTGMTLLLGLFGERFTGGTGTSFSVPQPSSCVLHSVLLPSLIDRFRTLPSVSRCCQPISDASACVRILDCKRGECGARDQRALLVLITGFWKEGSPGFHFNLVAFQCGWMPNFSTVLKNNDSSYHSFDEKKILLHEVQIPESRPPLERDYLGIFRSIIMDLGWVHKKYPRRLNWSKTKTGKSF